MRELHFSKTTCTELDRLFGLREVQQSDPLNEWLDGSAGQVVEDAERYAFDKLQALLHVNVKHWREQDLALHFIGPVFSLIGFTEMYRFNIFSEHFFSAVLNDIELKGAPDEMIASGYREPEIPFFCFTEFKKLKENSGDPAGQCLAAMLAGQVLNSNQHPLYGCFVIGSDWYFMTLEGKHYCISRDRSALSGELYDILRILKKLKDIIMAMTAPPS